MNLRQVMAALVCFPFLAAGMCSTMTAPPEPRIVIQRVEIPVPVPCTPDLGPKPIFPDTLEALRAAPEIDDKIRLVLIGRERRDPWIEALEAALDACRGAP